MAAPFYNNIKGTCNVAPGTGAFSPNAAAWPGLAWSTVPIGWWGLVRYEDGAAWELQYSYWSGGNLSRSSTQFVASSTGSPLNLTIAATAAMVPDANELCPHLIVPTRGWMPIINGTIDTWGVAALTETGTGAAAALATTNFLTEQARRPATSATTANAQAGWSTTTAMALVSTASGRGGYEFTCRFGASQLPTGPRLFVGMTATTFVANTGEPSALTANYAVFGKDSTDTNIQLIVNSNAGTGTKTDTGIPLVANAFYEATIWSEPGSTVVKALLVRMDTGAIWYGTVSTDVPANGSLLFPQILGGLSSTTGTAIIMHFGGCFIRAGG